MSGSTYSIVFLVNYEKLSYFAMTTVNIGITGVKASISGGSNRVI